MSDEELLEGLGAQVGALIAGKYRVEELLATGGMGAVVRARHEVLEQDVAIKLMRPEVAQRADLAQRFLREARAAARITSDYVARVTDVDRLPDGTPFMVMEYLIGSDLHAVITAEAPLPVEGAVDLVMEGLAGIDAAHRLGIVHRDLKPSNLFVVRNEGRRRVKVLDFGISKALDEAASSSLKAGATTSTDAILGTPRYMSPEQVSSSKDVDGRTDLWSMGLILYEALAGEYPYVADTAQALFAEILTVPVTALTPARADVPEGLERALLRCLERARAQRWATARDLMLALAPYASNRVRHALLDPSELAIARSATSGEAFAPAAATPAFEISSGAGTATRARPPSGDRADPELVPTMAARQKGDFGQIDFGLQTGSKAARERSGTQASLGKSGSIAASSNDDAGKSDPPRSMARTHAGMEVATPVHGSNKSRLAAIGLAACALVAAVVVVLSRGPSAAPAVAPSPSAPAIADQTRSAAMSDPTQATAPAVAPSTAKAAVPTAVPTADDAPSAAPSAKPADARSAQPTHAAARPPLKGKLQRAPSKGGDSSLLDTR